ncbi:AAA family ATPase [Rhodothalassium salexigens]|uniref:AAA family ATPase n=1 Tax=Rhodothalassium salexigens TaxID=1086 RepID=UPI0019141F30
MKDVEHAVPSEFEELLDWCSKNERPEWQKDALRRIAESGELTEDDIIELRKCIESLNGLSTEQPPELKPLETDHLSEASSDAPKTVLASLGPIKHVDRLESDQPPIRFAINGITLIYGANGSGKSGYCRVTKQLCRSLKPDTLRVNVYDDTPPAQAEVGISFRVGGDDQEKDELVWRGDEPPPPELARISVFDTASARVYVDKERKIEFLPYELDLLNKLALAARSLDDQFKVQEDALNNDLRVALPTGFNEGTPVSGLLVKLVPEIALADLPSKDEIEKYAVWTDKEQAELDRLIEESKNDTAAMARLRREAKQALGTVRGNISDCESKIGDTAVQALYEKQKDAFRKREAAEVAASDLFKGQPIPEIGSETWGQMLRYARDFALEVFPDGEPPQISTAGLCVLCQQELDDDASARLRAFDEYLEDRAAADAAAAKIAFEQAAALISNYSIKSKEEASTLLAGFSALDDDRKVLAEKIIGYFEQANARLTLLKKALDEQDYTKLEEPQPLPESLVDLISADETKLSEESEEFDRLATDDQEAKRRVLRIKDLSDRKKLSQEIAVISDRRDKLEKRLKIIACKGLCQPGPITRQITTRRRTLLTPSLKDALNNELKALRLTHIPVNLNDRGDLGNSIVDVALSAQQRVARNSEVLSEGEQRGLALACFLAELEEIGQDHGIIVDDPVSSLDHSRMQSVARRLAEEAAKGRQVIVFTHNILFHHMLCSEARNVKIACHKEWMSSLGDNRFGVIDDSQKPRQMKNVSQRLSEIDSDFKELKESGYHHSDEKFRTPVIGLYTSLRDTWERIVEEVLFNKAVQRFRPEVMTQRLEEACIDPKSDYPLIFEGMKRCSHYSGHDLAEDLPSELPEADDVAKDIEALREFAKMASDRRKALSKAGKYEDGVKPVLL